MINASTDDEPCAQLDDTDPACGLGDLTVGSTTTVIVLSPSDMSCILFAQTQPGRLDTYMPFAFQ